MPERRSGHFEVAVRPTGGRQGNGGVILAHCIRDYIADQKSNHPEKRNAMNSLPNEPTGEEIGREVKDG